MTNIRLNAEMREHLSAGGQIEVSVITEATIEIDGHAAPLDLNAQSSRRLVENAVLRGGLSATGLERILNRPGVGEEW